MSSLKNSLLRLTDRFIPKWFSYGTASNYFNYILGSQQNFWVDLSNAERAYDETPHLKIVIGSKANMFSNMKVKEVDMVTGEEVENSDAVRLLMKPNPLQSQEEFFNQLKIYESIYGNNFIYANKPLSSSELPQTLWNIDPHGLEVRTTGKLYKQVDVSGIISCYEKTASGANIKFMPEEVLHTKNNTSANVLLALSPFETLQKPISNIQVALQTRNAILNDRGALGILSSDPGRGEGAIPLNKEEKKLIEEAYSSKYGVGADQKKVIVTQGSAKWMPMSYPTKDLMLFEEIEDDFQQIIDMYGMNRDLFSSTKGATFENQEMAQKGVYNNTIIPEANSLMKALSNFLGLTERGTMLVATYNHLELFEEDLPEDKIFDSQLSLRGSVGGVTGLLGLNQSVADGFTDRESAKAILINIYGVEEQVADQMITNLTRTLE